MQVELVAKAGGVKLEFSIEKSVERLWEQAQSAVWSYVRFAGHVMAVLIILKRRSVLARDIKGEAHLRAS